MIARRAVIVLLALCTLSCQEEAAPGPAPTDAVAPEDAGDEAFVQRVMPLMWGRRPTGAAEVQVLAEVARQQGREALVRGMARSPEYLDWWELMVKDLLMVSRLGFAANAVCYGSRSLPMDTPDLAAWVRENQPDGPAWDGGFTMADLIRSALVLDDLSPVYRAHLIAHLTKALDDMRLLAAMGERRNRAETFAEAYLNRRLPCLTCHNSAFSVTDSADPALDRTWPLKGHFERALLGAESGLLDDPAALSGFFRRKGVLAGYAYTHDEEMEAQTIAKIPSIRPWGWSAACGDYIRPEDALQDDATSDGTEEGTPLTSFFITDHGREATAWDLERYLRQGLAALSDGLDLGAGASVDGPEAFAYLVAASLADRLWGLAFGSRLTIAHSFSRNQYQHDILEELTEVAVTRRFSLVSLLVAITTHPYFNGALPASGPHYRPVFDPFVADHIPVEERRNSVGDTIRRMPARMLLRTVSRAMGWPETPEFLLYYMSPEARVQRSVGVFLKPGDPGFNGVSFQSALAWEQLVGTCQDLSTVATCPLEPILQNMEAQLATVCELCQSREHACDWDARCCQVSWDAYCSAECDTGDPESFNMATWPKLEPPAGGDWLFDLVGEAGERTYGDLVGALKDRLLARPGVTGAERDAVEALLDRPLDRRVSDDDPADAEAALRRVCGALLSTPQFTMVGDAGATPAELASDAWRPAEASAEAACARHAPLFEGFACEGFATP